MNGEKTLLLLVAYGNPLRRDDGAGLALAEQLAEQWQAQGVHVRHLAAHQLTPELALEISLPEVQRVIFVDTTADAAETIQIKSIKSTILGRVLGHHVTPDALLLYAERLYGQHPPTWLITIPGVDFGFGEGFSAETMRHLAMAPALAKSIMATIGYVPENCHAA